MLSFHAHWKVLAPTAPTDQLSLLQVLGLRRSQRGIEATCHQRLDASLHEAQSRVRSPSDVAVLGLPARISLALFQRDAQRPQSLTGVLATARASPPAAALSAASW
jgi:hypothetical protein